MNWRVVVTTIQPPTRGLARLAERLDGHASRMIVAGDAKGPVDFTLPATDFLSLRRQLELPFRLPAMLPRGHYARKNVGYLEAIRQGAACIYETDDDSTPLPEWKPRKVRLQGARMIADSGAGARTQWVNVYRCFTDEFIWPRGFPLDLIHGAPSVAVMNPAEIQMAPIQQGLVNGSPDVDAVWRLIMDNPFSFERRGEVLLGAGQWCPFNSQNTWWWPEAFALMYIPSHCTFRMCDIWRSFVAQRCLWATGRKMVFFDSDVIQERNPHDLMKDFGDEYPGYMNNRLLVDVLSGLSLASGDASVGDNLIKCYEALIRERFIPADELPLVRAWLADLSDATDEARPR